MKKNGNSGRLAGRNLVSHQANDLIRGLIRSLSAPANATNSKRIQGRNFEKSGFDYRRGVLFLR